jgi:hypothetical protein
MRAGAVAAAPVAGARVERRVGAYRLVRELGQGGMGTVHLAVRDDDQFHKEVALKVLRGDLGSDDAVARFLDERQILATLEHPHIVRLLDGGSTDDGLPFLVMEYVVGLPITRYCDTFGLSVRQVIELFLGVCTAVQVAHQRLIVHRDLKPSNILVAGDGTPKLLDFGIAKLLGAGPREAQTRTGANLFTPEYGSPEQVRGQPITVATDVYALGAVLYELLSGARAHHFELEGLAGMMDTICEQTPRRPSEVAPPARQRLLAGDLDNIVLKALSKEPAQRYGSVEQLADDLRRHLDGRPVLARANTWAYRAGKLVRRHRGSLAALLLVLTALSGATFYALKQARMAERRLRDVQRLASTLLFETDGKGATEARELIVSRALEYLDALAAELGDDPALSLELARGYVKVGGMQAHVRLPSLGRPRDALSSYDKALRIYRALQTAGRDDEPLRWGLAEALFDVGYLYRWEGNYDLARRTLLEGLGLVDGMAGSPTFDHNVAALGLFTLWTLDKDARALPEMRATSQRALDLASAWVARDGSADARYWLGMAHGYRAFEDELAGDPDAALVAYGQASLDLDRLLADAPDAESYRSDLAQLLWRQSRVLGGRGDGELWMADLGHLGEAEATLRRSLALIEGLEARDSKDARTTVRAAATLADLAVIVAERDLAAALALDERAAAIYQGLAPAVRAWSYTKKSEWFLDCSRAELLARAGRRDEARASLAHGQALVAEAATAPGASFRDRGAEPYCRVYEIRARLALGEMQRARVDAVEATTSLRQLLAERPTTVAPLLGLVEAIGLEAQAMPELRCALRAEAALAWRAWAGAPTDFTRRRLAELELEASAARCR